MKVDSSLYTATYTRRYEMKNIEIRRVNQGWIVQVGCQQFVFTEKAKLVEAFNDYAADEEAARRKWCDNDTICENDRVTRTLSEPPSIAERY
jgi:hypothetical protein